MILRSQVLALLSGALLLAGCGSSSSSSSDPAPSSSATSSSATATTQSATARTQSAAQIGFEGVAIEQGADIASPGTTRTGRVDGIQCGPSEQLTYHIHAHLSIYVNGSARALPGGIGIPGSQVEQSAQGPVAVGGQCIYWLHTHAPDGIIHVESPTRRIYSLGNFFDEWHQPLGANRVAGSTGTVTAVVNGKRWTKSPKAIPLSPQAVIQLSVGTPVPPFHSMSWTGLQL